MKTVARLVLLYFTGTVLARVISLIGVVAIVVGGAALSHYLPQLTAQVGMRSSFTLAEEAALSTMPLIGTLALFFGSALLPLIFGRIATGRLIYVLPHGRAKLLSSALGTAVLLALVTSTTALVYYVGYPIALPVVFGRAFVVSFVTYSALYVALWTIGRMRTALGLLTGAMLVLAALAVPISFERLPDATLAWIGAGATATWIAFGAAFMLAPRFGGWLAEARARLSSLSFLAGASYAGGGELDLALGTHRPWVLALGQLLPLGAAAVIVPDPRSVFLYFVLLAAITGAIASTAAGRSRSLWLRAGLGRRELFGRVERAYWRHSAPALAALAVLLVAYGVYRELPTRVLALGILTLALGMIACVYLGLMMTRGIGWRATSTAVVTMALLMATAVWAADTTTSASVLALLEGAVLGLAVVFRAVALRRWSGIDWLSCRPETIARSRA